MATVSATSTSHMSVPESKNLSKGQLNVGIDPKNQFLILRKTFADGEFYSSTFKITPTILGYITPQLLSTYEKNTYPVITRTPSGKDISDLKALSMHVNSLINPPPIAEIKLVTPSPQHL